MKSAICAGLLASTLLVGGLWAQTGSGSTTPSGDFYGGLYGKPGDAVRIVTLEANLSTLSENPPVVGRDASGKAGIEIRFEQGGATGATAAATKAIVMVNITATTAQNEVVSAAHIHRGARGTNGPVVVDFNLTTPVNTVAGQMATVATQFEVTDAAVLAILSEVVNDPGAFYVNVHTQSNAGGHIRGQLTESGLAATRRLEQRLANNVEKDLADVKRLVVRLAQKEGLISPDEANQLLEPVEEQ